MSSIMNPVNSFEVNSTQVNAGFIHPGEFTSEEDSSLLVLADSLEIINQVSVNTAGTGGKVISVSVEEDSCVNNILNTLKINSGSEQKEDASLTVQPTIIYAPNNISIDPTARFYSDLDNLFGSIFSFVNESLEYGTVANVKWGPSSFIEPTVSSQFWGNVIYKSTDHPVDVDVELSIPVLRKIFSATEDVNADAQLDTYPHRLIWRHIDDINSYVSAYLRDFVNVNEKYFYTDIQNNTGLLIDLWVKMYFYPINNSSGMDACVTIKHPIYVESIENISEIYSSSFIKKWVNYIGTEAELFAAPYVGVVSDVGIGNVSLASVGGCLVMNNNGTVISNNHNDQDVTSSSEMNFTPGGDVYVNGYLKLQLHTKDCPVYP